MRPSWRDRELEGQALSPSPSEGKGWRILPRVSTFPTAIKMHGFIKASKLIIFFFSFLGMLPRRFDTLEARYPSWCPAGIDVKVHSAFPQYIFPCIVGKEAGKRKQQINVWQDINPPRYVVVNCYVHSDPTFMIVPFKEKNHTNTTGRT